MTARLKFFEDKNKDIEQSMMLHGRKSVTFSILRFALFIAAIVFLVMAITGKNTAFYFVFAAFVVAFTVLCIIHGKITAKLKYYEALSNVNSRYVARINGDFDLLFELVCKNPGITLLMDRNCTGALCNRATNKSKCYILTFACLCKNSLKP